MPGSTVYYTLDGSDPTVGGQAYTAPVVLEQTTVLRAVALRDGVPVSAVTAATYLVGEPQALPVISLITGPDHLWDEHTGIYANALAWGTRVQAHERPVTVQELSPEGELEFSVPAGIRIRRPVTAKHSFELSFRAEYGLRELTYPLFEPQPGQTYTRLVLRADDQDSWQCHSAPPCVAEAIYVRNQLMRDLHDATGQVAARGRWVVLYLNGHYWGLYYLTEHFDHSFLDMYFNNSAWYTSTPAGEQASDNAHRWHLLADWLRDADLSVSTQYKWALQQLDIESFTAFVIIHLWNSNTTWDSQDWYAARRRSGADTRWRLFVGDTNTPFGGDDRTGREALGTIVPILASLLASPQYQAYFTAQVERYLAGVLAPAAVRERLDALAAALRPALAAEAARWHPGQEPDMTVAQWAAALQRFADSLDAKAQRLRDLSDPGTLRQHLSQLAAPPVSPVPPPLLPDTRIALVGHHPAELTSGDAAVVAHLEARGATVTVLGTHEDSQHDSVQVAAAHDLLLLSSSLRLIDAAARYTQTTTPLIFWEPQLLETTQFGRWGGWGVAGAGDRPL